jgi:D-tyrosyl-tRNA(Tyr) deacylase
MRAIIQRVLHASVTVNQEVISSIQRGYCILIGIENEDTTTDMEYIAKKLLSLRLFDHDNKPWKLNIVDFGGELLCVSQFTLHALTTKGAKPDFHKAMKADKSKEMYNALLDLLKQQYEPHRIKGNGF